jgi:hypothetical protein
MKYSWRLDSLRNNSPCHLIRETLHCRSYNYTWCTARFGIDGIVNFCYLRYNIQRVDSFPRWIDQYNSIVHGRQDMFIFCSVFYFLPFDSEYSLVIHVIKAFWSRFSTFPQSFIFPLYEAWSSRLRSVRCHRDAREVTTKANRWLLCKVVKSHSPNWML